jgi:hypothetical protein
MMKKTMEMAVHIKTLLRVTKNAARGRRRYCGEMIYSWDFARIEISCRILIIAASGMYDVN